MFKSDGAARVGSLKTAHGVVKTPFFMPVATFASGRGIGPEDYLRDKVQSIISNAFLLSLRPGVQTVADLGGLHKFMGFKNCIFTDSGGFQSSRAKIFVQTSRKGVHLRSPFDGKLVVLTPQRLVAMQESLASDVAMVIDDMAPANASKKEFAHALENTHAWAKQCREAHSDSKQLLFAITQGGYDAELRKKSVEFLSKLDFDGYAIGGCAIGEPKPAMYRAVKAAAPLLPEDKPRYLMGVGSPPDVVQAVSLGVDCFDSIFPTRNARHNMIFTRHGSYQLDKAVHRSDGGPLEEGCDCWVCQKHSRAYIRHLSTIDEDEGKRLRQVHNVRFMMRLMEDMRKAIQQNRFNQFRVEFMRGWFGGATPKLYS